MAVRVQREEFDPGAELARFSAGKTSVGGICLFIGLVRDYMGADQASGSVVNAMTLEHYPGMTERQLEAIEAEAHARWPLDDTLVIHRYGRLEPGERIVLVAASSAHRDAAFEACRFLMDWLKTKAPFWKVEHTPDGDAWVDAKESDEAAASRWNQGTP
ncbi:Molybdenum cofactor biosynthesis protein MoaE [Paramagnetospirillum magnetotacticum MS-1]|uniref:Molybdopterin synthase catalytic subunit n=1 Tax=Paramagnetospirillum magnetotacticum MS-1 TaxID=272627 RepID=A0A0C2U6U6_PARME|nr:molybdenum cofactor biosynthesis protein MoaE [Paramagnetospirillum magnetotacticum]KIL97182.1 Molybdenum cofactor biosynthesis protein MoaE [Paramagnetospirillum magnetotacticum MS-1]